MSSGGYQIRNQQAVHFLTFAVVEWVDVFTWREMQARCSLRGMPLNKRAYQQFELLILPLIRKTDLSEDSGQRAPGF